MTNDPSPLKLEDHTVHSSAREKVLEHLFIGDLLRCTWRAGKRDVEVLRAEVDKGGYDVVFECAGVIRHVQLKTSHRQAKTGDVGINMALATKPSGCVIWIQFDPVTLDLGPFLWFGGGPGTPMPPLGDKVAKHTRGKKALRPNIRVLRRSLFEPLSTIELVIERLFEVNDAP